MKFYQEISLLPNADIGVYFIWKNLYRQIHLSLVNNKASKNQSAIGAAFPEYNADKYSIGTKLRLFADNKDTLEQMQCDKWLTGLSDYVCLSPIKPVPDKLAGHACFRHIKLKGNKEKLARRRAMRKGETFQEALFHYTNYEEQQSKLPFINITSRTNGQSFRLFIEMQKMAQPQTGFYSCYGFSKTSTVPLF